jgi:hypothetical protein
VRELLGSVIIGGCMGWERYVYLHFVTTIDGKLMS